MEGIIDRRTNVSAGSCCWIYIEEKSGNVLPVTAVLPSTGTVSWLHVAFGTFNISCRCLQDYREQGGPDFSNSP